MSAAHVNQKLLEAAVGRLAEDELTTLRKTAVASFGKTGFPSASNENWRYTNLSPAADFSNSWLGAAADADSGSTAVDVDIDDFTCDIDAHWIVASSGIADAASARSLAALNDLGVAVSPLSDNAESVQVYIGDPLSSFNASLLSDGLVIRVADNVKLEKPIGLLFIDNAGALSGVSQARLIIEVGRNASVQFVEMLVSSDDTAHFANSVMQLDLARGASADIVRIQACNDKHIQIGKVIAELHEDSTLQYAAVDVGGKLVRSDVIANIVGAQSQARISGVYLADGTQHIDNHILTDHTVGPAKSVQNYRGIIGGRARCVFNGKAVVREGADGSDAEQSNHNLLISDSAEIDTKPELEIFADDVKCSHGATVGQLDESALFYLRSRGLSKEEATVLLTRAFTGHVLGQLPIDAARNHVDQVIKRKLDAMTETPGK
jgi:Fe-S cluster assembly protein SufD